MYSVYFFKKLINETQAKNEKKRIDNFLLKGGNTPKVLEDVYKENDYYVLKLEKINGLNFEEYLNQNYSLINKLYCFKYLVENVKILHTKCRIKHGDLKPENVIIANYNKRITKENVYLIDFGLSNAMGRENKYTPVYKTSDHVAGNIGIETDIQVLGMILYRIIVGKPPKNNYLSNKKIWAVEPSFPKELENLDKYREFETIYKESMKIDKIKRLKISSFSAKLNNAIRNFKEINNSF